MVTLNVLIAMISSKDTQFIPKGIYGRSGVYLKNNPCIIMMRSGVKQTRPITPSTMNIVLNNTSRMIVS
jgi:hypothetical protein